MPFYSRTLSHKNQKGGVVGLITILRGTGRERLRLTCAQVIERVGQESHSKKTQNPGLYKERHRMQEQGSHEELLSN